jgi:hypothetical protein
MSLEKNSLSNVHQFIHWDWGQNYPFNGCMSFILECLGENTDTYDYWFFAGISGDIFTMCYGNNGYFNDCVSVCFDGQAFIKDVFNKIGYDYQYIASDEINKHKEKYIKLVMEYIDKGVPVLQRGLPGNANFDVIYGYDNNGKTLSYMVGDEEYKGDINTSETINRDWIFIGSKTRQRPISEIYREAIMQIPKLFNYSTNNDVTFGANAFRQWADDIENGRYDSYDNTNFNDWKDYKVYVCNLATNSGGPKGFLEKAYQYNPDFSFITEIINLYQRTGELWNELEAIGGGFNATLDTLQNPDKRKVIASKVRQFAECMDKVTFIIESR